MRDQSAPADSREWQAACTSSSRKVFRGGSFRSYPQQMRSAARFSYPASEAGFDLGFRVARELN
ncbi:MAG: SUMF1/EgtB/PvdO family nonheme iron enzyme [Hyphomicrobiales bacterium]|nr:SUMF1/EgtB/PvdO family nonheme iron enzyme [Hyphomicrobiales bacterium]